MPLTDEQQLALDRWAEIAAERSTIEEFLDWLGGTGIGSYRLAFSLSEVLDRFYDINRPLLESARRELLADAAKGIAAMSAEGRPSASFPHPSDLRRQVANACDSAKDNGLPVLSQAAESIAWDLTHRVPWLRDTGPGALVPHVEA